MYLITNIIKHIKENVDNKVNPNLLNLSYLYKFLMLFTHSA